MKFNYMDEPVEIKEFVGKVFDRIEGNVGDDALVFHCSDGERYVMSHDQICSERIDLNDVIGELSFLIGTPILHAEEVSEDGESDTWPHCAAKWTFYHISTMKGYVVLRWFGESNGYYSEDVEIRKILS